jgi:N-methylhydantoinase A
VLVPPSPGTLCALGSLVADVKSDFIRSENIVLDGAAPGKALAQINAAFDELRCEALGWLDREKIRVAERVVARSADIRYAGQSFEVTVDVSGIDFGRAEAAPQLFREFARAYAAIYGQAHEGAPLELINLRATAIGVTQKPTMRKVREAALSGSAAVLPVARRREIYLDGGRMEAAVYERSALTWGHTFKGPAIVEQYDTTAFVPPGFDCRVDEYAMIIGELAK